ncbi:MAG: hypothetical protein ACO3FE_19270, partial [Planctomycetaceae bacterium]
HLLLHPPGLRLTRFGRWGQRRKSDRHDSALRNGGVSLPAVLKSGMTLRGHIRKPIAVASLPVIFL